MTRDSVMEVGTGRIQTTNPGVNLIKIYVQLVLINDLQESMLKPYIQK